MSTRLKQDCVIVFDGPEDGPDVELRRWQQPSNGRPLFAITTRFVDARTESVTEADRRSRLLVIRSATLLSRAYEPGVTSAELRQELETAYGRRHPDITLVWPRADGKHPLVLHELARDMTDLVLLWPGGTTLFSLQVFEAMARREMY